MSKAVRKLLISIAFAVLLSASLMLARMPSAQSQGPGTKLPTWIFVSAAPNPVGRGQTVYVNAFMSKPTITSSANFGDWYEGITVKITSPSGKTETLGPFLADPTGGTWTQFVPSEIGNYTLQAFYPGQTLTGDNPRYPGNTTRFGTNLQYIGTEMLPSQSEKLILTVQEEAVEMQYKTPPLPDYFWSRPIYATNWDWAQLGGSWWGARASGFTTTGLYDAEGSVSYYTKAPNTGHILWTKPTKMGGVIGDPFIRDQEHNYESTSIATRQFEPIIIAGKLYYTHWPIHGSFPTSWVCVDLRTGEEIWNIPPGTTGDEILRMGQIQYFHSIQEYGAWPFLWSVPRTGTTVLRLYDANTGKYIANVTGASNPSFLVDFSHKDTQGSLLAYQVVGSELRKWNSSQMILYPTGYDPTAVVPRTFRPSGNYSWDAGYGWPGGWRIPINFTIAGQPVGTLSASVSHEVILLRRAPDEYTGYSAGWQITVGIDPITGAVLWGPYNQTIPEARGTQVSLIANREGYFVLHDKDTNRAWGYSSKTGQYLWGPVKLPGNAWSHITRTGQVAYETVYIWDFGGYCNALDAKTGQIKWTFTRGSAGYDAPYGIYPFWTYQIAIVDGKLFLLEGSLYNPPLHPAKMVVVDAFTGEEVWSILAYASRVNTAHGDGIAIAWNSFDCQIYAFGKGPTQTTVTAPNLGISLGSSVVIRGTVMDISAGTKDPRITARFPDGVPAVADECMSPWMEHVYMQQIRPTDIKGVWVTFDAISPEGEWIHVGGTHTDSSGMYSIPWTPPAEGLWTIVITFPGTESYYPSYAETSILVTAAPPQPQTPEIPTPPDYTPILTGLAVAVVIAIIIGVVNLLAIRKRQ